MIPLLLEVNTPTAVIIVGIIVAVAGWAIPYFTLRTNTAAQSVLIVDTARRAEVDQLSRRVQLLEDDLRKAQDSLARCEEDRSSEREKYIRLLEDRAMRPPPARPRRQPKGQE